MKRLSLIFLFLVVMVSRGEIIPAGRRVTWQGNVGIAGGIPNYTTVFQTIYPSDDTTGATDWAAIQNAVANCPPSQVVKLENGNYYLSGTIDFTGRSGVVIRGNGPKQTKVYLVAFPARFYFRYGSFDESTLSVEANLSANVTKGDTVVPVASVPSWVVPGEMVGIDQVDDEVFSTDFGQEGNNTYRKVLGHESLAIDSFPSDVNNWTPNGNATLQWFSDTPPAESGQSTPGVMKMIGNFTASAPLQTATATYTLGSPLNAALDYTRIYFWYRVDPGSNARASGDYGTIQFVLLNGAGLVVNPGEVTALESRTTAGWLGRNLATMALTNNASDVRKIQIVIGGTDMTGPVTVYIDAIKLIGGRGMMNTLKVVSKTTTNFTVETPLFWGFQTNRHAQIFQPGYNPQTTTHLKNCGLEDLSIESLYEAGSSDHITMENCEACWFKNIRTYNSPGRSLLTYTVFSYRCEFDHCFGDSSHHYGAGQAYGIALYHGTVGCLVQDCIFKNYHVGLSVDYGSAGNVLAYNYMFSPQADQPQAPAMNTHGTHTTYNLFEGNWCETKLLADFTHGSSSDNTAFRNYIQGYNYGRLFDQVPVSLEMWNRQWNIVGNVLGVPGVHTNYSIGPDLGYSIVDTNTFDPSTKSIFQLGYFINYGGSMLYGFDTKATMDVLIHGNWDAANSTVTWDGGIADHALPTSYYLAGKPAWWNDAAAWPPVNPTTTTTGNITNITIPAKIRYEQEWVPPIYTKIKALGNPVGGHL